MVEEIELARAFIVALILMVGAVANHPDNLMAAATIFVDGIVQGLAAPVTLLVGWFWHGHIYAAQTPNWFYDFGWMLGLMIFLAGANFVARRR